MRGPKYWENEIAANYTEHWMGKRLHKASSRKRTLRKKNVKMGFHIVCYELYDIKPLIYEPHKIFIQLYLAL